MISGTFHPSSQEWRYFSREKALIHTLHLSEIPTRQVGDTVEILSVPPTGSNNGFQIPPVKFPPITPFGGIQWNKVTNNIPPYWVVSNGVTAASMQSGSYGFISGATFSGLDNNAQNQGTWFWPMTGGTFLIVGAVVYSALNPTADTIGTNDESEFSTVQVMSDQQQNSPPPQNYANAVYPWKQTAFLVGVDWSQGRALSFAGNAIGVHPTTILQNVPYGYWVGQYVFGGTPIKSPTPYIKIFRLGPS